MKELLIEAADYVEEYRPRCEVADKLRAAAARMEWAPVAELERDAARYALLRQSNDDKWSVGYFDAGDWIDIFGEKLDAAIDAELAKEQK
jgi:hypothetical protein